jgi:molybdate transport system substrate-binding protein
MVDRRSAAQMDRRQILKVTRAFWAFASPIALFFVLAALGWAADLKVITSGAFTAAYTELVPEFERTTATKVVTGYGASMGDSPTSIPNRLRRGEPVDVVILASTALEELIEEGSVIASSRVDLVRSKIGLAVRAGAPKADISTVRALTRALLEAKSIGYSESASGVYVSTQMLQKLGIANEVLPKSKRFAMVGPAIASGAVEIGFQQISELLPVKGIDYIGPLPDDIQKVTIFSAGIATSSKEPEAARSLLRFLTSQSVAKTILRTGLEPITAR